MRIRAVVFDIRGVLEVIPDPLLTRACGMLAVLRREAAQSIAEIEAHLKDAS